MDIAALQSASMQALSAGKDTSINNAKDLPEATRQFEAVLIRQFLTEAMKPLLHETPESKSAGADIYSYMLTDAMAENLSREGVFGLSSMLQMQLADPPGAESASSVDTQTKGTNE